MAGTSGNRSPGVHRRALGATQVNTQSANLTDHSPLRLLMSMLGTRLELAAIDVESHVQATLVALMTAFVAVVLGLIAFAFIGIGVIVFFWETHRLIATASVLVAYIALAATFASVAR